MQSLCIRAELAAEAAAHVLRDAVDVRLRDLQPLGELLRRLNHRLRRDPRGELVAVPLAHAAMRFEAHVRDHMGGIGRLDYVGGLREAVIQRAGFFLRALAHVAAGEHGRGVGRHRLFDAVQMRQLLVLHADQTRRIPRTLLRVCGNARDRIALIHDLRARLFPRERGLDARRLFGRREIDRLRRARADAASGRSGRRACRDD
jgi:hypothetical protein